MPIRKRETPKFFGRKFIGYAWRFGQVEAIFETPRMQALVFGAQPAGPGETAYLFFSKAGLQAKIVEWNAQGLSTDNEHAILRNWPKNANIATLPSWPKATA